MPCIFCTAVFIALAGQVTTAVIDQMQQRLEQHAKGQVRKTVDTQSVSKFELDVPAAGKDVPVAVTVLKEAKRVRIQVLTHDIARPDAEKLENQLADVLQVKIVERSSAETEAKVREAVEEGEREPAAAADQRRGRWPWRARAR